MIRSLRIENFALIEQAQIQFDSGFTVITGETGSGKSILLNALNLILGERANFQVIGEAKDKSVVEAEIDIEQFDLKAFFEENELDYFDISIVRREIYKQGRSRAFINDIPVQLNTLKDFSSRLIHIHSQYNTLELKDKEYQLRLLDTLSGNQELRKDFNSKFTRWQTAKRTAAGLEVELAALIQKEDYNSFQKEELSALELDKYDYAAIQDELNKIENSDDLREAYNAISFFVNQESGGVEELQILISAISKNANLDAALKELHERLTGVLIEIQDIGSEAENQLEAVEIDPEKLHELSTRMDSYNKVIFKHRVQSQEELIEMEQELTGESDNLDGLRSKLSELTAEIEKSSIELNALAKDLHTRRSEAAPKISAAIETTLDALKLKDTTLQFQLSETNELNGFGKTAIEILFSPNKGLPPVPIHTAASGGELSRVMLALQNLMSKKTQLQTILFDEIDTGVSGDVAQKIGLLLKEMGKEMQVIAITHLPQVAAKGGQHLSVNKEVVNDVTRTFIKELNADQRLVETARLMSGDKVNDAALENARALMS